MFPAVRGPPAREVQEEGGLGENRLVCLQPRSPSTPHLEQEARVCRSKESAPEFSRRRPSSYLAAPVAAPAPPPPPQEAAGLLTPAEVTGREGNQAAGGGALPAPGPCPPPRPGKGGPGPPPAPKERRGRGASRLARGRSGTGVGKPPTPPEQRRLVRGFGRLRAPFPSRAGPAPPAGCALQLQEIPEALHHPGAARRPGCQGSPKESHMPAGRPTARPALASTQSHSTRQPRSPTRHPFPRPGNRGMRGSPGRGLF